MKKSGIVFTWLIIAVICLDMFTKFLIVEHFSLYESVSILPIFNLTYVRNFGAAFSFLADHSGWQKSLFEGLAVVISLFLFVLMVRNKRTQILQNSGYALIIGGALSNAYDRFTRGYVVDFFDFHYHQWHYPVFNVADIAICIGAGLLILDTVRRDKKAKAGNK